jgi:hypothetical protein
MSTTIARSDTASARAKRRDDLSPQVYDTATVARLFGVSYSTLIESVRVGSFPVVPIRIGARRMFPKRAIDALLGISSEIDACAPENSN